MTIDAAPTPSGSANASQAKPSASPKRGRSDYHQYYWDTCRKLAPRYRDWDNRAYEALLAAFDVRPRRQDRGRLRHRARAHGTLRAGSVF